MISVARGVEVLQEVHHAKYLGVTINVDLGWSTHVDNISKKSSNTLNFLRRNLKYCPRKSKEVAYFALVRTTLEYNSTGSTPQKGCYELGEN